MGSGSARGWSHIGVIRALEEARIPIDCIAGTSIGSLVGAFYITGELDFLEHFARETDWKTIFSHLDFLFPYNGLLSGKKVYKLIDDQIKIKNIEEARIPFCAIACDLETGEEIRITKGNIVDAVRGSISIPGIFIPFKKDKRSLVDGGLVNPVPINVAREMGADIVIAVDLNHGIIKKKGPSIVKKYIEKKITSREKEEDRETKRNFIMKTLKNTYKDVERTAFSRIKNWITTGNDPNIFDVIGNSINIMENQITRNNMKIHKPDILIQPAVSHLKIFDFHRAGPTIEEGYNSASALITRIRQTINEK